MEKKKRPTDISQLAYQIVQEATQEIKEEPPPVLQREESCRRCPGSFRGSQGRKGQGRQIIPKKT